MPELPDAWIAKARIDLDSAELPAAHGGHPDAICYCCQQVVEMVLKARIRAAGRVIPKIHNLRTLAERAGLDAAALGAADADLAFLTGCYSAARYPDLGASEGTPEDATRALRVARAALAAV